MTWDKQKNRIYIQMMEMTVYHDSIRSHKHVWLVLILIKVVKKTHSNCGWIGKMREKKKAYSYLSFSWLEWKKKTIPKNEVLFPVQHQIKTLCHKHPEVPSRVSWLKQNAGAAMCCRGPVTILTGVYAAWCSRCGSQEGWAVSYRCRWWSGRRPGWPITEVPWLQRWGPVLSATCSLATIARGNQRWVKEGEWNGGILFSHDF